MGCGDGILLCALQVGGELIALLLHCGQCLGNGQLARLPGFIEGGLQLLNLRLLGGSGLLQLTGGLLAGQFDRVMLVLFSQLQALVELLLKFAITDLFEDIGIADFIDFKGFVTVRADDFLHEN